MGLSPAGKGLTMDFPYLLSATKLLRTRVWGGAHRRGSKRRGLDAVDQVIFPASQLIDKHKLDHLFRPLPKALQKTFHRPVQLLTFPLYYVSSSRLQRAFESQTHASLSNSAFGVHLGTVKSATMRTFAPWELANTIDQGFGGFCWFVFGLFFVLFCFVLF